MRVGTPVCLEGNFESRCPAAQVDQCLARWAYEACIPFHAIDNDNFKTFVEAVGQFSPIYQRPSQYDLREPLLKEEECSSEEHTGEYNFEYVDKCIKEIGPQNVVQVVTDNASNNMAAVTKMLEKRPHMFKGVIEKAKAFTIFIYAHHKTLALMRKDIVRPGVIRFATSFLTLQSLVDKKKDLRIMVTSDEWEQCKHSKSTKGKVAYAIMVNAQFWNGVSLCLRAFEPLFKVLRLVDGDKKPSMGFLYEELQKVRNEIKEALKNNEPNYRPIIQIIDEKAHDRLDGPLHLAADFLNPFYFFKDPSIQHDSLVLDTMFTCVEKFFPDDFEVQNRVINIEMPKYKKKDGGFGRHLAEIGCVQNDDNYDPGMILIE
ncbi:hypothetical protein D8674_005792 [Pyrus ussuriensis x Pyrus communis]|uniref:DUF659 domain-containing protein n=1 Tax=Pyrus ussuriensis x Pyrus communis TaxID=2448454 RepID=A0A5N5FSH6_9ROSA|nr:hypothetical protein D8674_005792 [Pyrus ussuriensis x Pyrus communis]